jgi:Flp pilus assembly protein TadG
MVTLEVAVMLCFFLLPFVFGVVDASRYLAVGEAVTRAAREGAVWAARGRDPQEAVFASLRSAGLDESRASVTFVGQNADSGGQVRVQVGFDLSGYTALPWDSVLPSLAEASVEVRHE